MGDEKYVLSGPADLELPLTLSFSKLLIDCLKKGGDEIAVIDGATDTSLTFKQILQKSVNVANSLKKLGLRKGDVVSISSENRFEFTYTACAVFYLGGVVSPMNVMYKLDEIKHALNLAKPKYIFCSHLTVKNILQILGDGNKDVKIILFGNEKISNTISFDSLISVEQNVENFRPTEVDRFNDLMVIFYSSGTTGVPKGVMLTQNNVLMCASQRDRSMSEQGLKTKNTAIFSIGPWSHAYGFLMHILSLSCNQRLVYANKFEPESYLQIIEKHKITITAAVPPLVVFLAKHPMVSNYNLSSLETVWCGAAPLSKEIEDEVKTRLNLINVTQGYGLTETTLGVLGLRLPDVKPIQNGSVGRVTFGGKAKVVDIITGDALGPYKTGELCFKGPLIMKGYIGAKSSTENAIDNDGWLHTGDVGYYDSAEYFYIVDRIKELIKYKGYQVAPAELEAILLQHKGVSDAGVVGLPDEMAGELPIAFVVKQPNSTVSEEELKIYVASKVSSYKKLRGGIIFVQQIPKNPSGKILRRELKEMLRSMRTSKL